MPNTFEILAGFLDHCDGEVEGRELDEPSPELHAKLRALARGQLQEPERTEVLGLLARHPDWISGLAVEIRALREGRIAQ